MTQDEVIKSMREMAKEGQDWTKNPTSPYPIKDVRFFTGTTFYGLTDPQAANDALSGIDRMVVFLHLHHKSDLAVHIESKVKNIISCIHSVDRLVGQGYKREQCLVSLKQAVREFIRTLRETARALATGTPTAEIIEPPTKEQSWDKNETNYIKITEAVRDAKSKGRKISVPTLSRTLTPDGPMRYMVKYTEKRKPSRRRVHIGDFRKYQKTLPLIDDQFSEDAFEERQLDIKSEKKAKGIGSDSNEGYTRLTKKLLKQ